jgi:Tol biopolymer transport system component
MEKTMPRQFWSAASCLALVALLTSACRSSPAAAVSTPTPPPAVQTTNTPLPEPTATVTPVPPTPTETALTGDYLGQTPPGLTAEPFAPAILSISGKNHHTLSFSTDGNELYFTRLPDQITFVMKRIEGVWQPPERASFSGEEAVFAPDGQSLLFGRNGDLWVTRRTSSGWGSPERLNGDVNTRDYEFYASLAGDGTLYFTRLVGQRQMLLRAQPSPAGYGTVEELEPEVNGEDAYHPFVAPDGSYLLFNSYNRPGGHGETDIYVSFRLSSGAFGPPVNLGPGVNSAEVDLCPIVSPDGRYLFFTRLGTDRDGNWTGTPYWVGSEVIEQLRAEAE